MICIVNIIRVFASITALTFLVVVHAEGQTSSEPKKANFCDVVASPAEYDGKMISIEAILQPSFHSLSLYDVACTPKEDFDVTTQAILPDDLGIPARRQEAKRDHQAWEIGQSAACWYV